MNILITGGAGFIGSNLVEALLNDNRVTMLRILDDLSTGFIKNIEPSLKHPKVEFIEGDIRDYNTCEQVCRRIDLISHQAALGSVPRSIENPLKTNAVNITGTLNIFTAAKEAGVKRIVFAASSSTYGDSQTLPKVENQIGKPLSPYAVTKYVNELYADVYANLYGIEYIGLRYFNVFGPKQDPKGAYAAVIPLFAQALIEGKAPTINGDGLQSRDFTYVENAVQANFKALFTNNKQAMNKVYNVAVGERINLLELFDELKQIAHSDIVPNFGSPRQGDVKHSLADISRARKFLNYDPKITVREGLKKAMNWYQGNISTFSV